MSKEFQIWKHFIKSLFVCVHLKSDCVVEERIEKYAEDEDNEGWHCLCVCRKCGKKNVKKNFIFRKTYLQALRSAGVE